MGFVEFRRLSESKKVERKEPFMMKKTQIRLERLGAYLSQKGFFEV